MTTHPSQMWIKHEARPPEERCTYEVIPQGSKCKLYFDLEFSKPFNLDSSGEKMVDVLIKATEWALQEIYGIKVSRCDILVLDGSTETKFSQHLIFQTRDVVFQDNIHAGYFVKHLVEKLKENQVPNLSAAEQQSLFIKNDKGNSVSFVDVGVYSKNRNFRLFLSSKFGKNVPLVIGNSNSFHPKLTSNESFFKASLITHFEDFQPIPHQLLTFANEDKGKGSCHDHKTHDPSLNGYNVSPWNEIDEFIMNIVAPGSIRRWMYYEQTETIIYIIQGNKYCSSIGREHKRNQIKYVVNLPNATYYQSCFDPDCVRGPLQPLPQEKLPWFNLIQDLDSNL